jgi:hypothetical protein
MDENEQRRLAAYLAGYAHDVLTEWMRIVSVEDDILSPGSPRFQVRARWQGDGSLIVSESLYGGENYGQYHVTIHVEPIDVPPIGPENDPAMIEEMKAPDAYPCAECLTDPSEDPLPWCDCRPEETCPSPGRYPCRRRAHRPQLCPNLPADIPYNIVAGGESLVVTEVQEPSLWTLSEWQHVVMGDVVRLPGRPETEASVGSVSRQARHTDSREYTGQDGKVRDWVTPHEHEIVFARLILDGSERTVNFPLETPVEILMSASRRAALTVQQAFPGSELMS